MDQSTVRWRDWWLAAFVSVVLIVVVWWPLCRGGGLVGGDIYPYFFPQKQVVAESFAKHSIPLWHHRTGLGYPLHAESQAAIFYPTTQVLYRCLDIHSAYHVNLLLHYWLAFLVCWRFLRCNVGNGAALFGSLVFVYGWFPARASLEWSIIGGVYLPLVLWQVEEYLRRPTRRRIITLSFCFALHLLAGHFALAFISQLTALLYVAGRTWFSGREPFDKLSDSDSASRVKAVSVWVFRNSGAVLLAIGFSLLLAAVQLLPTLELKGMSQRQTEGDSSKVFDPAYGHMPPGYLTQVVASWWGWHSIQSVNDGAIHDAFGAVNAATNKVEAHLYWGLIPLGLMLLLCRRRIRISLDGSVWKIWCVLSLLAVVYATGWLMPVARHLPGFSFFIGPGRYLMVASLGGAVLASLVLNQLLQRRNKATAAALVVVLSGITLVDLEWSSDNITDAIAIDAPPLSATDESWIKTALDTGDQFENRVLSPGPNIFNLFRTTCVPVYLGIGPSIYYSEEIRPKVPDVVIEEFVKELQRLRITHVISQVPLIEADEFFDGPLSYPDSLLTRIWGSAKPVYLYSLKDSKPRITSVPEVALEKFSLIARDGQSLEFEVVTSTPCTIQLAELMYPGWSVTVNGKTTQPVDDVQIFRSVSVPSGKSIIRWHYAPSSFRWGASLSVASILVGLFLMLSGKKAKDESDESSRHSGSGPSRPPATSEH